MFGIQQDDYNAVLQRIDVNIEDLKKIHLCIIASS